jgi:hypothetical protein
MIRDSGIQRLTVLYAVFFGEDVERRFCGGPVRATQISRESCFIASFSAALRADLVQ